MKRVLLLLIFFSVQHLFAQLPEDALRLSWTAPSGTARQQAIGGAMGSLGGDISATFVNPAGLAFYKSGDFVLSPGFHFQKDNSSYLQTKTAGLSANAFNLGTSGLVFGFSTPKGSTAFGIAVNRTANFKANTLYLGQNNNSSFSEQYVEEFSRSGLSIDNALNDPQISYGTRMALYTYLIDTATINGTTRVIGQPEKTSLLSQHNDIRTRGGVTEIALGFAGSYHDKWYIGASLGFPIVNYHRDLTFNESDATTDQNNDFAFSTYHENYSSKGVGVNVKLGAIFRPVNSWRIGFAIHSPSLYALTDNQSASLTANTENYTTAHEISVTSQQLDQGTGATGQLKYDLTTPWKFLISGSYVFGESQDVKQQKGFITGDVEYVTNNSPRFGAADETIDDSYYSSVNSVVKSYYKSAFNFKLGGEMKFYTLAVRAGASYYMSPYKQSDLKADRIFLSGGLGYRNKGYFIDLTYVQGFTKDVNFPYRLTDKFNDYAIVKQTSGTVLVTFGFKFQ